MSSPDSPTFTTEAQKLTRGQLLDLLLDLEDRLRVLIRVVFARKRKDWERLIPEKIRTELAEDASGARDALERATLKQLIDTVLARWDLFDPILQDRVWVQSTLDQFRRHRNDLAHGLQPSPDDKVKIALVAADVGNRLPVVAYEAPPVAAAAKRGLLERTILWADDRPESNLRLRSLFTSLGAEVLPVLSNEEAMGELSKRHVDVIISDIDRGGGEPGTELGFRLQAAGIEVPVVFFIARYDPSMPLPLGAVAVTNDTAEVLTRVFSILRPDAVGTNPKQASG